MSLDEDLARPLKEGGHGVQRRIRIRILGYGGKRFPMLCGLQTQLTPLCAITL